MIPLAGYRPDVRLAVRVVPLDEAEMLTEVEKRTIEVCTVKVALVAPAGTVTLEGTLATAVLLLESVTCAPPVGAGPLSVTVPVEEFPPVTLVGFSESEERERDAELKIVRNPGLRDWDRSAKPPRTSQERSYR